MATGVQVWSQTASANSTSDGNQNWAEGMAPSQINDSARSLMASVAKWRDDNNATLVTGGTSVAYTITSNQVSSGLTNGYTIAARIHTNSGSGATLNVDGTGPIAVTLSTLSTGTGGLGNGNGNELQGGAIVKFTYNSVANAWVTNSLSYFNGYDLLYSHSVNYVNIQKANAATLLGNPTGSSSSVSEITLGTNLSFSGQVLNAGNNTPVVSVFTSTGTATWQSTTQNGNFPLYLRVAMVGGGGGGAAANTNSGSSGTDSAFSGWGAVGGNKGITGGSSGGVGGSGGANGTGTLIRRIGGTNGSGSGTAGVFSIGGGSALGGAGVNREAGTVAGSNAIANSGGGGAGGVNGGAPGGAGGGAEYVEFIVTSPATSYSYTVGGGGAGGGAGGQAGGNGAAGRVEVIAYWQ